MTEEQSKEWFLKNWIISLDDNFTSLIIEDLYQAFSARLMAEMEKKS